MSLTHVSYYRLKLLRNVRLLNTLPSRREISKHILDFIEWLTEKQKIKRSLLSLRDILSWVEFINSVLSQRLCRLETIEPLTIYEAYLHGACLTLLDGLAITFPLNSIQLKQEAIQFLLSTNDPYIFQLPQHSLPFTQRE
jgi:hypothetical protein